MEEVGSNEGIVILTEPISRTEAHAIGKPWYDEMVKGVVDIKKGTIALGGEYHMDANIVLIEHGSEQQNVWGFNIYPEKETDWIEYTSLINIRPAQGNTGMEVEDQALRDTMRSIIERLIV